MQAQVSVTVQVSNRSPAINEQFQLVYELKSQGSGSLSGARVSRTIPSQFRLINEYTGTTWSYGSGGNVSTYTYTQVLHPNSVGTFTLAPVEFTWRGKTYKSEEVNISVGQAPPESHRVESREYFIETSLSRETLYEGEPVIMTLRLYSQRDMRNVQITSQPGFKSFYKRELTVSNRSTVASVGGKRYYMNELVKYVLTPITSGQARIDPYEVKAEVVIGGGWFADLRPVTLTSSTAVLNVEALPRKDRPESFNGAVGSFSMKHEISSETTPADEPITYRIIISGDGDLNFVKAPVIDLPPDFEVYDPKITTDIAANKTSGTKSFEYLIIPRREGEYVLKPYEFSWFDPKKERYFSVSTPEYRIKVTKGSGAPMSPGVSGITKEDVELLGEDIRYIMTGPVMASKGIAFGSKTFIALMIAPVVLFIPLLFVKRYRDKRLSDELIQQSIIASKQTRRNLATAKRLMASGDVRGFYESLRNALEGWLANRLNIAQGELSKDRIARELERYRVSAESISEVKSILDNCEVALYAPSAQAGHMNESWERTKHVIASLQARVK